MISELILRRCRSLNLTKAELARRAGISRETLYRLIRGDLHSVGVETLVRLAAATHVAPIYLLRMAYSDFGASAPTTLVSRHKGDHASFVADVTCADNEIVLAGQLFTKVWEIQNTGKLVWRDRSYRCEDGQLVIARREPDGSLTPLLDANLIPETRVVCCPKTGPGETVRLSVDFRAPALPCTAMSLWKMYDADGEQCFPGFAGIWCKIRVMAL